MSPEIVAIALALEEQQQQCVRHEEFCKQDMLDALSAWDRDKANRLLEIICAWNRLHEFTHIWLKRLTTGSPVFVVDAWFLRDLIAYLTPGKDEEIAYVTGPKIGTTRVLSRLCTIELESHSVVHAQATGTSCADQLITMQEQGNELHVMAHSHPGQGPGATRESSIDINYLGKIQSNGSEAIGIIVTRDGYVRFFTVTQEFQAYVQGSGVTHVSDTVYKVDLPESQPSKRPSLLRRLLGH